MFDDASALLKDLRRKKQHYETKIKEKLNSILQSRKQYLADGYITQRAGKYVLPVQKRYQNQFGGTVVDRSSTGATVFMEPKSIASLQQDIYDIGIEEDAEERRILYTLSSLVAQNAELIAYNQRIMEDLDFLFAKAKLSFAMKARQVEIGTERKIIIKKGKHPLLNPDECVPLDFEIDNDIRGVIITGPNTGGKTVALKTVGLLSLMAQCGLHIPCNEGSYISMQDGYWCDIGDSQNITQNLSTFSGHMTNVIKILKNASKDSLVILDELGSGTDPAEGMGIAVAVLEELKKRKCMYLVTTHYTQVKSYAKDIDCVMSARMAFDLETLAPLYKLEMGKSGESCALHIASRLGLPEHILEDANYHVYGTDKKKFKDSYAMSSPKSKLVKREIKKDEADIQNKFSMGDSVVVMPQNEPGIVYKPADENGDVVVQIKGVKTIVKHTRIKLRVKAIELYPDDYDFSVIFDSVENRKANRILGKRYDKNVTITREKEELF